MRHVFNPFISQWGICTRANPTYFANEHVCTVAHIYLALSLIKPAAVRQNWHTYNYDREVPALPTLLVFLKNLYSVVGV
jgi:hypothetical protein